MPAEDSESEDAVQTSAPPVGLVAGTEDSTPLQFCVALDEDSYLQLDDVVVTLRDVPDVGPVVTSGIVTQVRARHEGASYGSDVFLISDGVLPARTQEIAEVSTTRVEPEIYVPPRPGEGVRRATGTERAQALYFDQMDSRVPVGRGRDGDPIYVNMEFLDGTRGAHVSISGISGVATKTSFALFLLHSIFRSGALGPRAVNAKALLFSVKGEDLLFLDQPNVNLNDDLKAEYAALGLPAEPFASAGFWAPPIPDDTTGRPNVTGRTSGVEAFWWTLEEFCDKQLLPYVFADAEDERNQYTIVIHQVAARLRREAMSVGDYGAVKVDGAVLRTYPDLVDLIIDRLTDEDTRADWAGPVTGTGTVNAFVRRLRSSLRPLSSIIRADLPPGPNRAISTENQQLTVVDLHNLHERAQRFVTGVVLAAETARKEDAGPGGLLFTMIDELNKYAPREGNSPIKDVLLDIAERGRSLGIILIGAQQTASEVERRIVSNSAIRVVGRLDSAEAGRPEYGFLPQAQRARATIAKPGAMFVSQPQIPVPLAVEFPFPAWATRLSECAGPVQSTPRTPNGSAVNGSGRVSSVAPSADLLSRLPDDDDIPPF
ncbi:MAG: ATP-binding protein [Streptosporangiales bacterium]|nr:ATP-binding protein [Streptosporangiales bacterium]